MPPRYSYWTIIAGGLPTAFRAAEREELMPTFTRLREKHPDAEMRWFARGKLWDSPEAARQELGGRRFEGRDGGERQRRDARGRKPSSPEGSRDRDWRPGGEHRDPRQPYADAKKARNLERRKQKFVRKHGERPHGGDEGRPADSERFPRGDRASRFDSRERKPHAASPEREKRPRQNERRPSAPAGARPDRWNTRGGAPSGSWGKQDRGGGRAGREGQGVRSDRDQQRPWHGGGQDRGVDRRSPQRPWSPRPDGDRTRPGETDSDRGRPQRPAGPSGERDRAPQPRWNSRGDRPQRPAGPGGKRERPQEPRWGSGSERDRRQQRPAGPAGDRERPPRRASNRDDGERPKKSAWSPRGEADRPYNRGRDTRRNQDRDTRGDRGGDLRGNWRGDNRGGNTRGNPGRETRGNHSGNTRGPRERDTRGDRPREPRGGGDRNDSSSYGSRPENVRRERNAPDESRPSRPRWDREKDGPSNRSSSARGGMRDSAERGRPQPDAPPRRKFEPPSFGRNQGTEEPAAPPRPRGPNREPRPSESPEPTPPPRPNEPVTTPPGPPERGRLVKNRRRP